MDMYEAKKIDAFLRAISVFIGDNHLIERFFEDQDGLRGMVYPKLDPREITCENSLLEYTSKLIKYTDDRNNNLYYVRNPFTDEISYLFVSDKEDNILVYIVNFFSKYIEDHTTNSRD